RQQHRHYFSHLHAPERCINSHPFYNIRISLRKHSVTFASAHPHSHTHTHTHTHTRTHTPAHTHTHTPPPHHPPPTPAHTNWMEHVWFCQAGRPCESLRHTHTHTH